MNDLDDLLAWRDGADDILADGARPHLVDECLDYRKGNVGLDQRVAHFAERFVNVAFGECAAAAKPVEHATKPRLQTVEHFHLSNTKHQQPQGAPRAAWGRSRAKPGTGKALGFSGWRGF